MNRTELLAVEKRKWDKPLYNVSGVYVIPSRRKHDSGYACMDFVASTTEGLVGFGGCCDDVVLEGSHFRMDCDFKTKLLHIWNSSKNFTISIDLPSIHFIESEEKRK